MHKLLVAAAFALSACSTVTPVPGLNAGIPEAGATPGFSCDASGFERFHGELANVDVAARIRDAAGARTLRWTGPGMAVTMDYRTDRVNVELNETLNRIVGITCG